MIFRAVSDENLITSQKYVIMIMTAAIITYLYRVYRSLCVFLSMDAKQMKEIYFMHIFDVHSRVVYRLAATVPRLEVTAIISYNNAYDRQNSHPIKRVLLYHVNIYIYINLIKIDHEQQIVESHRVKSKISLLLGSYSLVSFV